MKEVRKTIKHKVIRKDDYDCFSYDRNKDKTIDKCLNCTRKKCSGNCYIVKGHSVQEERAYLVRAKRTLGNGRIKYGYIRSVTTNDFVQSVSDPEQLSPKTYSAAYWLKQKAEKFIKDNTILEVVKVSDIIEGIEKNE